MVSSIAFCTERGEIGTVKMLPKLPPKTVLSTMGHQMTLQFTKVQIMFGENGGEMTGKVTISFEKQVAEIYETAALPLSYVGFQLQIIPQSLPGSP